ncbi:cysteine-rich protein [Globomyces pollinis-pini]|nr:cysteine-rich protein [Globomyces pollinis-pini]
MSLNIIPIMMSLCFSGPISFGICQNGCNALAISCYATVGLTFGMGDVGVPAVAACNSALGFCMNRCVDAGFIPYV